MAPAMSFNSVRLTPAPTSSSSTTRGSVIMVRPSSSSFFCPPERLPAGSPATASSLRNSMTSSARAPMACSCARIFPGRNHTSTRLSPDWPAGTVIRFSRTVSVENSWAI